MNILFFDVNQEPGFSKKKKKDENSLFHISTNKMPDNLIFSIKPLFSMICSTCFITAMKMGICIHAWDPCLIFAGALLGGNVAALKYFMPLVGLDLGPPREPMRAMTESEKQQFMQEIEDLGYSSWNAANTN